MSNANANGNGKGEKDFFVITYGRQYLDSTLRQENDYYVNDWENFKKVANEKGDYVEFEEEYVEEGNVKYKKIKRICRMSQYKKEINDLNKSSDLNKSNVNKNASASLENNAVLTLKNKEKDEEKEEIIEIKVEEVEEDKGNEEDGVVIKEEKEETIEIIKDNSSEIAKSSEEDQDKDEEKIEVNLKDVTLSSFEIGVHKKEIDDLNKTNALNENNTSEDKDKDHKEDDSGEKEQNNPNDRKKDVNRDDEQNEQKTEIVKLVGEAENNIDKNQKKKIQDSNTTIDISKMVGDSSDFDSFCSDLEKKGVAFNQIDFSKEPLGFLNCFRAFFSILFSRPKVNCGFWNLVYLKVSYEFVKSNGKSFCFEAHKAQNESNIDWLSSLINKAKQQASEEAGIDVNNRNPDKQQLH